MIIKRVDTDLFLNLLFKEKLTGKALDYSGAQGMVLQIRKQFFPIWKDQQFTLTDGVLHFQWNADENTETGIYDVRLSYHKPSTISENQIIQYKYDAVALFRIVPTSDLENVETDTTDAISVSVSWGGTDGMSAYEIAVKHGYAGTEEQFAILYETEANRLASKVDVRAGKNLINGYENGKGIYYSGNISDYNAEWDGHYAVTDKIYWETGETTITCNGCCADGFSHCQYDSSNNPIPSSIVSLDINTRGIHTFHKAEGAVYIRFTLDFAVFKDMQAEFGTESTNYEKFNEVGGYFTKTRYITANSDPNSDADFKGNTAIKDAINSITDNSEYRRYVIKATGHFEAKLPSDYTLNIVGPYWAMFMCKPWVYIDGISKDNCVIRAELPDALSTCQEDTPTFVKDDYGKYQPFFIDSSIKGSSIEIKNVTFSARNTRYPLHIDGSSKNLENCDILVDSCTLIHDGKYGDSIDTIGGSPSGFGASSGLKMTFRNCIFGGNGNGMFYIHSNTGFDNISNIKWENCTLQNSIQNIVNGIHIESIGDGVDMNVEVTGCKMQKFPWVSVYSGTSFDIADSNRIRLITDMSPLPIYYGSPDVVSLGLKITSSTTTGSSVRFVTTSAFNDIVGYSDQKNYIFPNRYNREQQYGYQWKDGGVGLSAIAIGLKNLAETSVYKIGTRLGDCSTTNKTLGIIIDGITYTVTFNKNYTSMTNDAIVAEINTAINGHGVASLYNVNGDWYPEFNNISSTAVDDTTAILAGMGIVYTTTGARRAKNSDNTIDGIALDDGVTGQSIRVITKGSTNIQDTRYSIKKVSGFPLWYDMSIRQSIGISTTQDGYFDTVATPTLLIKTSENSVTFNK